MSHQRALILHALTPLHIGTGRGEGHIDLPIARDSVTEHPLIPGSGVKGPLRAACAPADRCAVFGPDANAHEHASAVRFSDARLIAMPCASDYGTFAWVTSPLVLARWKRDTTGVLALPDVPAIGKEACACHRDAVVRSGTKVVLDGNAYTPVDLAAWPERVASLVFPDDESWRSLFVQRFVVIADDAFDALARTGTDVRAHIRIDPETGTVDAGALWYEESVPSEAVFASVVQFVTGKANPDEAERVVVEALSRTIEMGGGKTTGMGTVRGHLVGGAA